jgi:hypothetical protein
VLSKALDSADANEILSGLALVSVDGPLKRSSSIAAAKRVRGKGSVRRAAVPAPRSNVCFQIK